MKKAGTVESFVPKSFINEKSCPSYSDAWDLYIAQSHAKLQKSMNWSLLHEGQFGKK